MYVICSMGKIAERHDSNKGLQLHLIDGLEISEGNHVPVAIFRGKHFRPLGLRSIS